MHNAEPHLGVVLRVREVDSLSDCRKGLGSVDTRISLNPRWGLIKASQGLK